ncbi:hypothetical protein CHARACLAT_018707, partial [Characodon lateralis]|nr:hypothetical protein [Characodon lateralis]
GRCSRSLQRQNLQVILQQVTLEQRAKRKIKERRSFQYKAWNSSSLTRDCAVGAQ